MEPDLDDFNRYLKIYNADIDWRPHLLQLKKQLEKRYHDPVLARSNSRTHAAFSIIYPTIDKTAITDPPYKILFYAAKHPQLETKDWYKQLTIIMVEDAEIKQIREELIAIGTIDPIYYVPRWRQAYYRLWDQVTQSGIDSTPALKRIFENLVKYYGGTIINSMFQPQFKRAIDRIPNWRTPYFIERLIFKTYKKDELLKIRTLDIQEIQRELGTNIKETKVSKERNHNSGDDSF